MFGAYIDELTLTTKQPCDHLQAWTPRAAHLPGPGLGEWVADPEAWPGLRSLVRVQTERTSSHGRRQHSVRYCISSRPVDTATLPDLIRGH